VPEEMTTSEYDYAVLDHAFAEVAQYGFGMRLGVIDRDGNGIFVSGIWSLISVDRIIIVDHEIGSLQCTYFERDRRARIVDILLVDPNYLEQLREWLISTIGPRDAGPIVRQKATMQNSLRR